MIAHLLLFPTIMTFVLISTLAQTPEAHVCFARTLAEQMGKDFAIEGQEPDDWEDYAAEHGVDMYFISCRNHSRTLQHYLNACRGLRLPYVFLTDTMLVGPKSLTPTIKHIVMPVSLLEEEVHKAQIGVHVARFTGAETTLLQANDYGSKAATNVRKIQGLYDKFALPYSIEKAKKDSFHIVKEVADRQRELGQDLSILTASRDYGLDDVIFGPVERYALRHSQTPVMLLNPRGDLFALCD